LRFAEQQVQRMHVPAAHMQQACVIDIRSDDLFDVGTFHVADFVLAAERLEVLFPTAQRFRLTAARC
ncbi:MAG: hypothetical protein K6T31_03560, partial [Alicyclobacillus sp.]|nr:hypothetical protein [Alicyclobacillus sp.]